MIKNKWLQATKILQQGKIALIPTDTIYGLLGQALNKKTVAKIYKIKGRKPSKPLIILISSLEDLNKFSIKLTAAEKKILTELWPGPISIILKAPLKKYDYLHRGTKTLSFRLPANKNLIELIKKTGPLVAPSANPEGQKPAETIKEASEYFKDQISFYLPAGSKKSGQASTLISLLDDKLKIIRPGQGDKRLKRAKI